MNWIKQDPGRQNCGQIAVAVIAGVAVEHVERIVGHGKRTRTKTLAAALRHFGFDCPDRCRRMPRPELGLAQVRETWHRSNNWHWVVVAGDLIYDGIEGDASGHVWYPDGIAITSYLPVTPR